ncbi:MAG: DUF1629 domain-containing protein [Kiritimatiellae bacterium]|nr:DUF1629 domain-containing protein [Verrucomicrobiota bacterium]MBU4366551.1 DUF1629 domain-containing protein [Verrucomicrobiota bacterium]MCG2659367.1 DUF1629 domain-containing protein [Kiritimatiellia bacterium]
METRDLTVHEKQLLKQIVLLSDPNARQGFTIVYDPELPAAQAGCYVPCVPPSGEVWKNDTHCPKAELDQIQGFAGLLNHAGALQILDRKEKENGGYYVYYLTTDRFKDVYRSLDPDGFAEVAAME